MTIFYFKIFYTNNFKEKQQQIYPELFLYYNIIYHYFNI